MKVHLTKASSGNLPSGFAKEDLPNFNLPSWSFLLQSGWGVALVSEHCCNSSIANGNTFILTMSAGRLNLCGQPPAIVFMLYEGILRALPCAWMTLYHIVLENATYISYLLSSLDTALCPFLSPNTLRLSENMTSRITTSSATPNTHRHADHTLRTSPLPWYPKLEAVSNEQLGLLKTQLRQFSVTIHIIYIHMSRWHLFVTCFTVQVNTRTHMHDAQTLYHLAPHTPCPCPVGPSEIRWWGSVLPDLGLPGLPSGAW